MLRLSSFAGTSNPPRLRKLIALVGLLATVGCSPSKDDPAAGGSAMRRSGDSGSATGTDQTASSQSSNVAIKQPKGGSARGDIPVDSEGYVLLGPSPQSGQPNTIAEPNTITEIDRPTFQLSSATESLATGASSTETPTQDGSPASIASLSAANASSEATDASSQRTDAAPEEAEALAPEKLEASKPAQPDATAQAAESGLASYDERHQEIAKDWPKPQALLFFTGQQHGYIEPCGCTGLENQKGGLNRRDTLLNQLNGRGWDVVPMDVGNFERRAGRQAEIKFQTTVEALKDMRYRAATLGVDDLKLSSTHLLSLTATEGKTETPFISSNTHILVEEYMPKSKIIEVGGRKIGVTAVLGDSFRPELKASSDVITAPAADSVRPVLAQLKKGGCDYLVLLAHATLEESQQLAVDVPGFDLVVTSGGYPEPFYQLETISGSESKIAQVGAKGMYTVLVGLYPDDQPVRYQRVALSSQFPDSPRMLERFANYQKQLQSLGFDGLGLRASTLPEGRQFVGSEKCGDCHSKAYDVWKASEHFTATESLVHPPNDRSMIPRHFDPECLSCHVTGWNAKSYFPYASGYTSLEKTPMLTGSGCENCHGPGSKHVAAESGDIEADEELLKQLQAQMRLPLAEAKTRCLDCHDQDNSPDFQHDGAFEKYWEQIAHPGKD